MLNRRYTGIISLFIVAVMIVVLYYIFVPPKVLTRENNTGNEFEQLDRLMNTTRYVEQVRKAGYQVDDYDLKMMDRIPKLEITGEDKFIIEAPTKSSLNISSETYNVHIKFDKHMNLKGGILSKDGKYEELSANEKEYYKNMVVEEINRLFNNIYRVEGN